MQGVFARHEGVAQKVDGIVGIHLAVAVHVAARGIDLLGGLKCVLGLGGGDGERDGGEPYFISADSKGKGACQEAEQDENRNDAFGSHIHILSFIYWIKFFWLRFRECRCFRR